MLVKMNEIREMQERLTLKHFEIDHMRISQEGCVMYCTLWKFNTVVHNSLKLHKFLFSAQLVLVKIRMILHYTN